MRPAAGDREGALGAGGPKGDKREGRKMKKRERERERVEGRERERERE
jgi:hypothetical protein